MKEDEIACSSMRSMQPTLLWKTHAVEALHSDGEPVRESRRNKRLRAVIGAAILQENLMPIHGWGLEATQKHLFPMSLKN
ncbi:MAG TPA: hypothetical protein PLK98_03900 [Methanothrix sp.]|nr:hypothetical protein [Methanothrix sp.]